MPSKPGAVQGAETHELGRQQASASRREPTNQPTCLSRSRRGRRAPKLAMFFFFFYGGRRACGGSLSCLAASVTHKQHVLRWLSGVIPPRTRNARCWDDPLKVEIEGSSQLPSLRGCPPPLASHQARGSLVLSTWHLSGQQPLALAPSWSLHSWLGVDLRVGVKKSQHKWCGRRGKGRKLQKAPKLSFTLGSESRCSSWHWLENYVYEWGGGGRKSGSFKGSA